jgi:serine/threonine protein phosphatase 1
MNGPVKHVGRNPNGGRDIIVGDIHGAYSKLMAQLNEVGFDKTKDRLFSVGDLVDRGSENEAVLQLIGEPWFFAVAGNHEQMLVESEFGQYADEVRTMHRQNGGEWFAAHSDEDRKALALRLSRELPVAIELETEGGLVIIVHAGVSERTWAEFKRQLEGGSTIHFNFALWDRARIDYGMAYMVEDVRAVVVGHNQVRDIRQLGNHFYIDTGWMSGRLTLFDAQTLRPVGAKRREEQAA